MFSRRKFLGVSLAALIVGNPKLAEAFLHRQPVTAPFVFQANPNVTTSAVNVSAGITCNWTSSELSAGLTNPAVVSVSADFVTCTATNANGNPVLPYEDLMYVWTDGQGSAADTVVDPTNNLGTVVSLGTQYGPEATFMYRTAGTYTITLTVYYQTAPGVYANVTQTLPVKVVDFGSTSSNTRWADQNATGANDGTSAANAWTSTSTANFTTWLTGAAGRKLFLAQGQTWINATTTSLVAGATNGLLCRIDSYAGVSGAGAKPIIKQSGSTKSGQPAMLILGGPFNFSGACGNIAISNIQLVNDASQSPASTATACAGVTFGGTNTSATYRNIYLDNVDMINTLNTADFINFSTSGNPGTSLPGTFAGLALWKCTMPSPITNGGTSVISHSVFGGSSQFCRLIGCSMSGSAGNQPAGFIHHTYIECFQYGHYAFNTFGETGLSGNDQRSYCINLNLQASGNIPVNQSFVSNLFGPMTTTTGGPPQYIHDCANVNNAPPEVTGFNLVFQSNFVKGLTSGGWIYGGCSSETIRYNNFYGVAGNLFAPEGNLAGVLKSQIYKNNIDILSSGSGNPFVYGTQQQTFAVTSASPCTFTCNIANEATGAFPVGTPVILSSPVGSLIAGTYYVATAAFGTAWALQLTSIKGSVTPNVNNTGATGNSVLTTSWIANAQTVTDNSILDNRTTPALYNFQEALSVWNPAGNASLIDRNNYSWSGAPSTQTPFSGNSYSTWSGSPNLFDVHSTFNVPSWSDPAHGIFS